MAIPEIELLDLELGAHAPQVGQLASDAVAFGNNRGIGEGGQRVTSTTQAEAAASSFLQICLTHSCEDSMKKRRSRWQERVVPSLPNSVWERITAKLRFETEFRRPALPN